MNYDLLVNLHFYIDTIVSKIIELIDASPYNDTVSNVITEHKIEVSIFDEMLESKKKKRFAKAMLKNTCIIISGYDG